MVEEPKNDLKIEMTLLLCSISMEILIRQIPTSPLKAHGGDLGLNCGKGNLQNSKVLKFVFQEEVNWYNRERTRVNRSQCSLYVYCSISCAHVRHGYEIRASPPLRCSILMALLARKKAGALELSKHTWV
jgi:hypothetical protein